MAEYTFQGSVTLRGVTFYVKAATEAEAREKARKGDYEDYDALGAETSDWEIHPSTCKEN